MSLQAPLKDLEGQAAVKPTVSMRLAETCRSAARKQSATASREAISPVQYLKMHLKSISKASQMTRSRPPRALYDQQNAFIDAFVEASCKRFSLPCSFFSSSDMEPGPIKARITCLGALLSASTRNWMSFSAVTRPT